MILLEVILIGGIGSLLIAYSQLEHVNRAYDESKLEIFDAEILHKTKVLGRRNDSYYIYTEDWNGGKQHQKIRVAFDLYEAASIGGNLSLHQKSGKLGYRWISNLYASNKVNYRNDY